MNQQDQLFNTLSLVMLGLTVVLIICYALILVNPYIALNPFPPHPKEIEVVATPTGAVYRRDVPPTWTPTATPTITPTPPPSFTPTITPTPTPRPPTNTPSPTPTITPRVTRSAYPFTYELTYEPPYYGCNWLGVAGTIQDLDGNSLKEYPVHVWGGGIDQVVNSGTKQMYGDAGWEQFFLGQPTEMKGVFRVQLHSPYGTHPPVSEEIVLNYEGFCSGALARIVFTKNH
ncbi:MAG: hypothetical protein JXA21_02915 [Anaerolineae bacterium]|nr:hypothetical protein [Anaerolineae bacterium]